MSTNLGQRQVSRKRQPLEVLQGSPPEKVVTESPFSEWQVPQHNLLSLATLVLPDSPLRSSRAATPLKDPPPSLKASTHPRSPLRPVGSRRAVSMATQRFNYYLDGQQITLAHARRAHDYELGSDQDLASSQPVSLAQLYKKTTSRNKAGRNSRSLFDDTADYMAEDGGHSVHGFDTRGPYTQHANTGEYTFSNETGHLTPPQRFVSQGYPWQRHETATEMDQEESLHHDLNKYQTQRNPLSYTNHGNPSQSRNNSGMSESPFLRKLDRSFPNGEAWPAEAATVSQATPFSTSYSKMQPHNEYMAPSPFQLYRDSFDRPQDKSPYETIRLKHRNHRTDLPEINSGLQFGFNPEAEYEPDTANATIRSEPTPATKYHARLPNIFDVETTGETLAARKPLEELKAPKVLGTHSRISSGTSVSQRTIKEEIYAILDNLSLGPNTNPRLTSSAQASESTETGSSDAHREQLDDPSPTPSELRDGGDDTEAEDDDMLELKKEDMVDRALGMREGQYNTSRDYCDSKKGRLLKLYVSESPRSTEKLPASAYPHKPTTKTTKPPPGLSRRFDTEDSLAFPARGSLLQANKLIERDGINEESKEPACFAAYARLQEVNKWFHKDNRGEDELRQHIANIAENFVENRKRRNAQALSEQDNMITKQLITTVGGVLANLHAYTPQDKRDPARYFANYKGMQPRCYEARTGGQRSYFDWNPAFDSWRRVSEAFLEHESDLQ
ncbi:hypothetical protein BJY00DRAFT_316700 [Aspergillus carlsbadensis]|nr:hypothetical protein BJY00DRAFT_316700 [Aspergillus carlsbadensis]